MTLPSESTTPHRAPAPATPLSATPTPGPKRREQRRLGAPSRTCIGCRRILPAATLLRCRVDDEHNTVVVVDRVPDVRTGRGAWVCGPECAAVAISKGGFDRAFRRRADTSGLLDSVTSVYGERVGREHGQSGPL